MVAKVCKCAAHRNPEREKRHKFTKPWCTMPLGAPNRGIDQPCGIGPSLNQEKDVYLCIQFGRYGRNWIKGNISSLDTLLGKKTLIYTANVNALVFFLLVQFFNVFHAKFGNCETKITLISVVNVNQ